MLDDKRLKKQEEMGHKLDRISREDAITPLLTTKLKELLLKEEKKNIRGRIVLNKTDK